MSQLDFCGANIIIWESTYSRIGQEKTWTIRLDFRDGDKITCGGNCSVGYNIAEVKLWVSAWWPFVSRFLGTM